MNQSSMSALFFHTMFKEIPLYALALFVVLASPRVLAQTSSSKSQTRNAESASAAPQLVQPAELAKIVQSSKGAKPLIFYVGYRVLYLQAHIPHSEYIGPASEPEGIQRLRTRVENLRRTESIVLYCGCCPWTQCPNINPAYKELRSLGFKNVKLLYIAHNFGADWVDRGHPVAKGE
jgi:hypothetical protein